MSFNPDPNKQAMEDLLPHQINSSKHPPLYFNNQELCSAANHKHLGLLSDSKLKSAKHIIKYRLLPYGLYPTIEQIYKIFVRPHLDYSYIIYHLPRPTSPFDYTIDFNFIMQSLESTQYQAALAVYF